MNVSLYYQQIFGSDLENVLLGLGWFYGISTFVGYLMPNPFLYI